MSDKDFASINPDSLLSTGGKSPSHFNTANITLYDKVCEVNFSKGKAFSKLLGLWTCKAKGETTRFLLLLQERS